MHALAKVVYNTFTSYEPIRTIPSTKRVCERLATLPQEPSNEIGTVTPHVPVSAGNIEKKTYPLT